MKATLSFQKTSSRIANLSFLLALLLCALLPQGLRAQQTVTVCDGTTSNEYVPFQGWNADAAQHNQMIYPASGLTAMSGKDITQMVFYIDQSASNGSNTAASRLGTWTVSLGETSATTLGGLDNSTSLTQVYQGYFDCSSGTLTLTFSDPYHYNGGNLLVDLNHAAASYNRWYFLGVTSTGSSYTYGSQRNFLPKVTFTYETPASCPRPSGLAATLTQGDGTVATLNWTAGGTESNWIIEYATNSSFTGAVSVTASGSPTKSLTGLTPETTYYARVKANCGSDQSEWCSTTISFKPTNAVTLTVNDGTSTNSYVPIYGTWVDNYSQGQFIIPATELTEMMYGNINKLTFYASNSSVSWGAAMFEVYMMEVNNSTLDALVDWSNMTQVMNAGSLSISGNQMVVELNNDYQYQGGNLLIGFHQTVSGSYSSCSWYGVSATGASFGGYSSGTISQQNFLPKMTIAYVPGEAPSCPRPTSLAYSNLAARSVTLSWTNGGDESSWIVEYATNSDFTGAQTVTANSNPYTLSGLSGETHYYVRVKAVCGGNPSDESSPVNFTTLPTCLAPTNLTATPNAQSATLTWESSTGSFSVAHATSSSANPDDNIVATVSTTTHTLNSLTLDQDHYVWVRANCGGEDGNSSWTGPVSFHIGYCTPAPTSVDNNGISNVTFGTGDNVVNNTTPKATYADYHTLVGAVQVGIEATIDITYATSYTYNTYVWVDFDNSLSFEADEIICYGESTNSNPTTLSLSFTLPVTQATGDYLMRIGGADSGMGSLSSANPCYSSSYGVFQDYTLRVLPAPSCMPVTSLAYSNLAARSVTLSWTNGGDESSWVVEYATNSDFTGAQTVNATTNPYTLTSLTPETHYWFRVKAVCGNDLSDPSNVVDVTTAISCPAPTGLATSNATATSMTLAWTDNATNAQNYQVQYGTLETTTLLNATFESGSIDELGTITNDATYPWTVVTDAPEGFNGTYCIKSTNSGVSSSTSSFSMTVTLDNDGTISFRGGCWGEGTSSPWDKCIFSIDGTQMFSYGALQTWSNYSFALTAGTHVLAWSYSKDSSVDPTGDAFYVDDIVISTTTLNAIGTVTANSNPYTLQGLEPGTTYTAQVRNFCGYTQDDYSLWTDAVTFTTLPAAPSNLTISDVSYTSALLSWTPGGNETVWFYQLGTDDPIIVTGTNSLFFSNLEPSTTYSVKLRSRIGENLYSEWTAPVEFTTLTCNTPTGLTINNVTSSGVNFSWTPGSNETNWQYMLNSNPAVSVVSNQIFVSELDAATTYTVKVRAQCANNVFSDWTDPVEFTTLPSQAACAAPTGFNATVCGNDATLRWTPGGSETNWMVQYTATGDYANATTVTLDHPYLPLTGLTSGTTYYAHVKSLCGQDESSWSSTQFSVSGPSCYTAGEGGTTNDSYLPSYSLYNYSLTQQIYTPAEVGVTGSITSLSFYNGGSEKTRTYDLYLVTTSKDAFESTTDWITVTASNKVFSGTVTMVAGDWTTFTLNNPFPYDGTSNLAVIMADNTGSWSSGLSCRVFDATNMAIRIYQDASAYDPTNPSSYTGTLMNVKNQIRFCSTPAEVSCAVPTDLTASNVTAHTASVTWTAGGNEQTWIYKMGAEGDEMEVTDNTINLTGLAGETTYTVYVCAKCSNTDYSCWSSVDFTTDIACPVPTNLATTTITATSATFVWTAGSTETAWQIRVGDGDPQDVTTNTATIQDLTPATSYTVYVRAICGGIDGESEWTNMTFTTAYGIPFLEAFGTTSAPANWNRYSGLLSDIMGGTATLSPITGYWNFGSSNSVFDNHARLNIYGTGCKYWLVTPAIQMESNVQLTFDLALTAYSGSSAASGTCEDDRFVVLISTDNGANWTSLAEWNNSGSQRVYNAIPTAGDEIAIDLSNYSNDIVMIAFYGESTVTGNGDNNLHVDNVSLDYIPACVKPSNLTVNYTEGNTAEVSWISDASNWNIDVNGTVTAVTTNPYTLTGLDFGTTYTVKMQTNCGNSGTSEWTSEVSFTTDLCQSADMCDLTFALTDSYGDGWNGNAIQVVDLQSDLVLGTFANTDAAAGGEAQTYTLSVCNGREIQFQWVSGSWAEEASYVVYDNNGEEIFSGEGAMSEDINFTVNCGAAASTCDAPANVDATVCDNEATLRWPSADNVTSWTVEYGTDANFAGATSVTVEQPNFNITGLTSGNTYYARVKASCGTDESGWTSTQFSVAGASCHTAGEGGTATNNYLPSYNFYNYSLSQQIYTPAEVGVTGFITSLSFYNGGSAKTRTYDLYLVTTSKDAFASSSDWITVTASDRFFSGSVTMVAGDWTTITLDNPFMYDGASNLAVIMDDNTGDYSSSPHMACLVFDAANMALRVYSDGTNYNPSSPSSYSGTLMSVKNQIRFCLAPAEVSCQVPTNLTVSNVSTSGATLSWTAGGNEQTWVYKLGVDGEEAEVTSTTVVLTDLVADVTYDFYVCAKCGNTDYSCWTSTQFTASNCHTAGDGGTATNTYLPAYTLYNNTLSQQIYTPSEVGSAGNITSLAFYNGGSEKTPNIKLYLVPTNKTEFTSTTDWITASSSNLVYSHDVTFVANDWTVLVLDNPFAYDGTSNLAVIVDENMSWSSGLACRVYSSTSNCAMYVYSDDTDYDATTPGSYTASASLSVKNQITFCVEPLSSCPRPMQLTASNMNTTSATITWAAGGSETAWQYRLDNGPEVDVTTATVSFDNLTAATTYDFYVRANCGNETSDWSHFSFTTEVCNPADMCSINYSLTDSYGDGWNGAAIQVVDVASNEVLASLTFGSGSSASGSLSFCPNTDIRFVWVTGNYDSETSYTVTDGDGEVIVSGSGSGFSDPVNYTACPVLCPKPTNLTVNNITSNGATASWTGETESYNLRYRSIPSVSFVEDFENGLGNWTNVDADGDGYTWDLRTTGLDDYGNPTVLDAQAATSASWISGVGALTPDNWLISPLVDLQGTLSLWLRGQDPDYAAENFAVYLSTTGNAISDFTTVLIPETSAEDIYTEYTVDLSSYMGQQGYIAIRHFNTTDMFFLNLDNVRIANGDEYGEWVEVNNLTSTSYTFEDLESLTSYEVQVQGICENIDNERWTTTTFTTLDVACSAPTFLTATDFTLHGATLSWTAGDEYPADGWEYSIDNGTSWLSTWATAPVQNGTTVTATIGSLEAGQSYEVRVRAICGNYNSRPSNAATVTPTCYPATDLVVDENSITTTSAGLTWTSGSNASSYQMRYATEQIPLGWMQYDNNSYVTTLSDGYSERTWGVMYPANLVDGFYLTKINLYETANNTEIITVNVYNGGSYAPTTLLYTEDVIPLGNGWHEITFESPVAVDPEQNLWITLTEAGTNVISLCTSNQVNNTWLYYEGSWNHIGFAFSDQDHGFMIRAFMEDVNWITVDDIASASYTLEGLEPATHYVAQVQSDCGGGDYSTWSNPVEFSTLATCHVPSALTVGTVGVHTAELSWTASEDNETSWMIQYAVNGDWTNAQTVEVSGSPATTLSGLAPTTIYKARVKSICDANNQSEWTTSVTFTTLECATPTDLEATNITHNSANIGWEGNEFAAEYEIMFGAVPPASGATFTYDFENGSIGSSFTNNSDYPWTVTTSSQNNGHSGTYCIMSTNSGIASSTSSISTTVNFQSDGTVSFRGGCWGEGTSTYWDHCDFYIDNDRQLYQGALDTWDTYTYNVTAGSHTFTWSYTKDGSVNPTGDVFYVDDIVFSYMASVNVDYTTVTSQTDSYSFTGLDPETTYTVLVRTNCGDGDYSEWSEPYEFTTLETCPAPTNLLVSSITYSGASLSWNHSMYHYNYQYIVVPTGENPDWSQAEVTTQRIVTLSDLDDYTTYDVYVRSYCANTDEYSNEISTTFSTLERCAHPDQLTVDNVTMRSATLSWNERGTATQWTLQYATDENFTQELQTITVTEEPTYTLRCLTSGTTYYARVLANCEGDDVVSRYSNVVNFAPMGITYEDAEITVYDGTVTNSYVPVYGFYADAYLKSEFVIPSSELGNLETISSMKFYSSTTSASWGDANFQVFLKEVGSATISDFSGSSNGTIVYQGSLSISGGQMTVNFTSPYTYNGGNLLVGVYNTVEGSYVSCSWYGQTVTGASVQGYSYSGLSSISASQRNFIPKTTFVGTAAVQGVTSIAGAIVSGEFESCQSASPITIESEEDGDVEFYNWYRNGTLIEGDDAHGTTYTVTTEEMLSLTPEQTYTYIRKALDECANNAEEVSEGSYSITLHASVVYDESLITNNSPIYCGNDGVLAAPHDDTWQHLWYTDPECTNLYYTGDVVTIRQMSVSDTLWHKAQPVNMVMTPRQTQVYIFQEGCESASMPAGWTTSGNGNEWTVAIGGENDYEYLDAHTGTYNFWVDADGAEEWSNLLSPRIDLSNVTNATLSFWYINPDYWGDVNRMVAQYRVGTGSWTNIVNTGTTAHDDWTHVTYTLPGGQSNYQLRFRQYDYYGYPVCIDDIEIYTTTTVYDTTYSAVGCPSIAEAYVLQVNEHPQPSALDTVATFCGVPTPLAVNAMESEDFLYQWSTNEDFTDTVALGTEATVISTELGNHSYFVRSYTQSDESISVQYLLQEGFDNGLPSGWTNLDADGDGFIWVSSTSPYDYHNSGVDLSGQGHNSSNGYAISGSYSNAYSSILYPDNWLITPALSIPEGVDEANLSFWLQAQDESYYSEHYGLYISTTGTTPSDFTQVYQETLTSAAARPSWLQKTADLTSYAGQTVYVAIRHFNCSDEFLLNLDDFEVSYQLTNYETGCTSPAKEVVLKVQPASAAEVTNEPIICGTSTTLTLNVPDEVADYYEYTWYGSATSSVALYTGTEYTTPALYNDNTSYYVQGHLIGSDECASERIPVTVVLKPILQPVINNNQPFSLTCGTPLTLSVSNSLGDMSGFTYIWYDEPNAVSEAEIARTPGNDASLLLHDYDNTEDRTIYVLACKFNEYEQQRCVSTMDTVVVNIVPIDPVDGCDIYYTYEYSEEHDAWDPVDNVCLGDELELQIYGQTPYYDENNEPIENFTVWYRRHVGVNTDSVRYGYTPETQDQDIYIFNGLADTVGTWEYYAYAATHLISAEGEGTLSTSLENTYNLGCVTFEVTAPLAIELDTISLIPNQENATVQVSYSYHAGTDLYNDAAWTFNGNYAITKDGDNPVPIQLTTPIGLSARDTVWIRLKSAENLLFEPLDEKSLLARDNRRVRLTSGYSFTYSTTQQQSSQTSTNLQDAKFLGSIHYNLSGGLNFACMSEESCEKVLVVDLPSTAPTLTVTKGSESDADFDVREDGYHVCKTASGLVLTATTNVFGDHAEYVWLQKAINDEEFSEIEDYELLTDEEESNTTVSIFVEVPDTTTIFAVSIHSLCCGETDTSMVKMYVSETPAVADIFDGATDTVLCAPYYIASNYGNPEIDNDGDWILSRGWEISIDGEDFADWDPQQALTTEHNDYYIRYRATTKCLSGYSNTTHIIVDTVPYYAESLVEPYAICGGNTFDWDANSLEAVYTNNSEFEIRTGYNLYAGGQLTEITADFVFTYHADEPDYYQYNCYTINYCDSVVSNLVTIPVWASPDIVNQLPTPVQDCAGKKIGDYFAEFEDHPDYEDNGNTIFHGWEIAPMVGSNDFTVLSDGVDIMDEDVIVNYEMNGKIVRYYVDNECGRIATLPVVLNVTDHPYVGELAEIDPVCDGTPFEMDEPEITDDGGIYRYKAGWYFVNPETMELTDTVNIGDPMTLDDWNGKYLIFGATNTCGTGFSNPIQITVNVLPAPQITVSRNDVEVSGTEFCLGPNYSLTVSTTDPNELYLWSDDLGTDNIADLGRLEEGEYSYSVVASNETTGCSGSASIEFTISAITFDTTVTVCEGGLPYTFDEQMQAVFEDAGEYTVNYTTAEGCDSVVNITLNVNRPRFERTVVHLCNGQSYEWPVNGQTYGGSSAEETVLTDTVILSALSLHDDVTGNLCDSIIYTLRVSISNSIYLELPQGDEFTVAVGEQVTMEANVRGGCSDDNAKTSVAYQLFKDDEAVASVSQYGQVNISTYLPVLHTSFGRDLVSGQGEIPGSTFAVNSYQYNYFYSNFFREVDNRITATLDEPGDYRLQMVIVRMATRSGQDFPMTYRYDTNEDPVLMGGANATPTDTVFSDTVNIYFHVDGDLVVEEPEEPTTTNSADLVLDQNDITAAVGETNMVNITALGDGDFKVGVDYEILRNGEPLSTLGIYGSVRFETEYPGVSTFGANVNNGSGSILNSTFSVWSYQYDYFYMYFCNNLPTKMTASWNVPGEYVVRFRLNERTGGQDLPLTSNNRVIGGHGSSVYALLDMDSVVFHVDAETVQYDIEETICESNLPYVFNGHEYTESGNYTFADEFDIYDTVLNLTLHVVTTDTVEFTDDACGVYEWNGVEYTESGDYTQTFTSASTGCDSVTILHLTIINEPVIRISASNMICESEEGVLPVSAEVIYEEGFNNETTVSFAQAETSRDTVEGLVTVRYAAQLTQLHSDVVITVTSVNSVSDNSACTATDTVIVTVIPADTIADFTAAICQGELYEMMGEGWDNGFSINTANVELENMEPMVIYDTIVTGTSMCGTYRAALALTVNPVFVGDNAVAYNDEVCEGYDYEGYGFSLTAEEINAVLHPRSETADNVLTFTNNGTSSTGCDSVTVLTLTVNPTIYESFETSVCSAPYYWNNEPYEESGEYFQTFTAANGCDSVVIMTLTINEPTTGDTTATACYSFDWYEYTNITESGDYVHVFTEGDVNGCDSTVTLHLEVLQPVSEVEEVVACGSYEWNGTLYEEVGTHTYTYEYTTNEGCTVVDTLHLTINPVYNDVTDAAEITSAQLPYEWNGVTFTAAGTQVATLQSVNGCDSIVTMTLTLTDVEGSDAFMTVSMNEAGDSATVIAFANQTDLSDQVSIDYQLYKNGTLVEDVDYECGGRLYIGTEFQNHLYGAVLTEAEGNIPGNTFHISNYHYEYFYWAFLNGRASTVTHSFTEEGEYTVVLQLVAEEGGTYFPMPYDDDYTHRIGGKNSLPGATLGQPVQITFTVGANSGDDTQQTVPGPTMTITGPANGTVADTMTFASNGFDNEKVAIRYTIYDANDEPLSMLSSYGSVRIATAYNSTYYGDNLSAVTGFIPEASFHPVNRNYNYFYAGFLATTHNTITANWTVPGTYKITFELVQMTGGLDQQLTYGTEFKKLGGRNATVADVIYDTKTITYTSGNATAQNPAATGIDDNTDNADGFVIYPNPARDRAMLMLGQVSEEAFIIVTDINGKEVHRADITDTRVEFNVSTWAEGVYFVTLRDKDQIVTKKLVVTK